MTVDEVRHAVGEGFGLALRDALRDVRRRKLGLRAWSEEKGGDYDRLWKPLIGLLEASQADFTLFFRQLSLYRVPEDLPPGMGREQSTTTHNNNNSNNNSNDSNNMNDSDADHLLRHLAPVFYTPLADQDKERRAAWADWLMVWLGRVAEDQDTGAAAEAGAAGYGAVAGDDDDDDDDAARRRMMRLASPKYVPREWMLVEAYEAAERGDYSVLERLQALFAAPYDEHPDLEARYYTRTPPEYIEKAGVSFFS